MTFDTDGDAVLFSDESEIVAKAEGLHRFFENETEKEEIPLEKGPLIQFAWILGKMQKKFRDKNVKCPIRTYLVTARRSVVVYEKNLCYKNTTS